MGGAAIATGEPVPYCKSPAGNKAGRSSPLGPPLQFKLIIWFIDSEVEICTICLGFIGKLLSRMSPIILSGVIPYVVQTAGLGIRSLVF